MSRQVSQDRPVTDTVVPGDQIIRDFSIIPFEKDPDSIGRKEVLQWLEEREDRYVGLLGDSERKTHVALQYAHHVQQRFPEIYIFWVGARSRTTLEQSYQDFAARLHLVGYSSVDQSAYKVVHDWLCDDKNGPWLMFVDDIHWDVLCPNNENDQTGCEPLKSFLPERGQGSVIFTSRDRRVATQLAPTNAIYSMKIPGKDEAFALLQKKLGNNVKEEKAAMLALVEALAYSPLAICQAAANMTRQSPRTSVSTYLSQFTNTLESLDLEHRDPSICIENPIKTASHITSRQNCLKRNTVADALLFMSFFDPQDIPTSALQSYAHDVLGKTRSAQLSPHILHEYLAPSKIREPEMFKTYPYLQIYTQKWLLSSSETQCWIWGLFAAAPEAHDHLSTITSKLEILEEDEPPNTSDFLTWSKAQSNLAIFHILLGNHSRASWIAERVVGADVRKLGSGHTETLRNMDNFAFVLRRQESPDVSQSISPVAWALQDQGGWEEAETLHWQLLSSQIRLFDKDHPYIAASLNNLVLDLRQQKKHEEAYAITKIFFENGLNIESIDRYIQIVLSWATAKGWEHDMRLLLDVVANLKADSETECSAKASCSPDDYDSEHSDNDSVFSIPHSLSSITTLGTNAGEINLLLVQQLSSLLYRDDALISLIGTAVSEERIGYERMRNNFRKLLKHYAKDLKAEVTTDQHQNLVGFVSAYSAHITRELFSMSPIVDQNRIFAKLTEFNGDSNSSKERLRKVEDYLSSVDKDKSADPEMDTDNSSDEDCMDAEDEEDARYDGSLENLNLMENFVLKSVAYQSLHRRLHDFVHPSLWSRLRDLLTSWSDPGHEHHAYMTQYKLRNLAAELRHVEPRAIHISRSEQYNLFSYQGIGMWQNVVERWSGERWDWWPLPSCPRRLQGYEALVQWKCVGLPQY
ncbi:nucleoside phosphorylase domain [Fusarium avenaceum]|nr:nucleoside phosphorylase domain [Fusarium avenaceum]